MTRAEAILIYPPSPTWDNNVAPLGLLAISSFVNGQLGRTATVVANVARSRGNEALLELEGCGLSQVRVVGITAMSTDVASVLELASRIREAYPKMVIVVGGPHATLEPEFFLEHPRLFDAVVRGEGETPFLAILQLTLENASDFSRIPGVVTTSNRNLLDQVSPVVLPVDRWANPFKAATVYEPNARLEYTSPDGNLHPATAMVTSRSCPLSCNFCSIIAMGGSYRSMPADVGVRWLVEERESRYFEHIYFLDADFLVSKARAKTWSMEIAKKLPGVTWSVQANVGHVLALKEILPALRERGLVAAELGIEAGNDRQLLVFNKTNFGKPATVEQSMTAISILRAADIAIGIDYIMFYPELSLMELAENLTFILRAGIIDLYDLGHYSNELMLFPGTGLRKRYEESSTTSLSRDELPDVRNFYQDAETLVVRDAFLDQYVAIISRETATLRRKLRKAARESTNASRAAELRLEELRLRHQPYHVLSRLIREPQDSWVAMEWARGDNVTAARLLSLEGK